MAKEVSKAGLAIVCMAVAAIGVRRANAMRLQSVLDEAISFRRATIGKPMFMG